MTSGRRDVTYEVDAKPVIFGIPVTVSQSDMFVVIWVRDEIVKVKYIIFGQYLGGNLYCTRKFRSILLLTRFLNGITISMLTTWDVCCIIESSFGHRRQ